MLTRTIMHERGSIEQRCIDDYGDGHKIIGEGVWLKN